MEGLVGLLWKVPAVLAALRERIGADVVVVSTQKAVVDVQNATAQQPMPGGAKEFAEHIARQRAHVAKVVKALIFSADTVSAPIVLLQAQNFS